MRPESSTARLFAGREQGFLMIWPDEQYGGMGIRTFVSSRSSSRNRLCPGRRLVQLAAQPPGGPFYLTLRQRGAMSALSPKCASGGTILAIAMTGGPMPAAISRACVPSAVDKAATTGCWNGSNFYFQRINADLVVVAAKTDPENNPHAMTLFLVRARHGGIRAGPQPQENGTQGAGQSLNCSSTSVKVPGQRARCEPGKGFLSTS